MSRWDQNFAAEIRHRQKTGLYRTLKPSVPHLGMRLLRDGAELVNFSSNDYLGLAQHPLLAERSAAWGAEYGTGAGASRLVTGHFAAHAQIERKVAALKGTEAALILPAGWQANVSVLGALLKMFARDQPVQVFADQLIHSSLHHGCRVAGNKPVFFRHNDLSNLRAKLQAADDAPKMVITESVFSMDGDRADLLALRALCNEFDAFLYVAEAHATGVLGEQGRGLCHAVPGGVDLVMGTFSKALGSFGAYVAGSAVMIDFLINTCAGFIFTTGLPPNVLGAVDAALDLLPQMDDARARVAQHATRVRAAFAGMGIDTAGSTTQIVPALVGSETETLNLAEALKQRGVLGVAIRPPTVPPGTSRIRFALSAGHSDEDVDLLISAMREVWPRREAA